MLLAIDIGNTHIVLGLYQRKKLITHWRLFTQAERTADEYGVIISHLVSGAGFGYELRLRARAGTGLGITGFLIARSGGMTRE